MAVSDNQDLRPSERAALSLVLSIFRGENFAVKGGSYSSICLRAKCYDLQSDLTLESGTVKLTPSNSEPEFNSQLAWSLTKKQLKDLRSNRSTIKVSCIVKDDVTHKENEVGYVVLHVKDATVFPPGKDVDPSKARTFPLLGAKDPWKYLQPKLHMILHLEDIPASRESDFTKSLIQTKTKHPHETETGNHPEPPMPVINAAKLAETKVLKQVENSSRFIWTVNDRDGFFQLGNPADEDDLYILNTTVISASGLHCIWDGKSPPNANSSDDYYWQVKYSAYGCEIASEPFLLDNDNDIRTTFIGDKATARIRTNGALFFQYLEETSLEFHVIRYRKSPSNELTDAEVMGFCFASLAELTDPNRKELKLCMDIVSEWGTPRVISTTEKPEVRILLTLQSEPNYFARLKEHNGINEIRTSENAPVNGLHQGTDTTDGNNVAQNLGEGENKEVLDDVDIDVESLSNHVDAKKQTQVKIGTRKSEETDSSTRGTYSTKSSPKKIDVHGNLVYDNNHRASTSYGYSNSEESESDESDSLSNKENLAKLSPERGNYHVTIELKRFWLKSKNLIRHEFLLSYIHPPIGIFTEPIEAIGKPMDQEFMNVRQAFWIADGEFTTSLKIKRLSESLLNKPLTVEFCRILDDEQRSKCFSTAMIPFGRIFTQKDSNKILEVEAESDILKNSSNCKIGSLEYKIQLCREADSPFNEEKKCTRNKQSSFFPPNHAKITDRTLNPDKYGRITEKIDKAAEVMGEWRKTQEDMYRRQKEDKEAAYLKLLSDEAAKRDAERERVMSKKLHELEKKEKEFNRQKRQLEEREEKIRLLELEVKDKERQLSLEKESLQQMAHLGHRRLEEDHKVEIEALTRRIQGYVDEIEKLKRKINHLEKKLEAKDAEIDALMASKREQPDSRLKERVALLEQENKTLKGHLREANSKKEQYKKQSLAVCQKLQRVQEERDQALKNENENLRLHIIASKEHKELKKDRKTVQDLSQKIKALQRETIPAQSEAFDGKGDQIGIRGMHVRPLIHPSKESEMRRLSEERAKLLKTGAYTPYDMVIKELENKMVALAKQD